MCNSIISSTDPTDNSKIIFVPERVLVYNCFMAKHKKGKHKKKKGMELVTTGPMPASRADGERELTKFEDEVAWALIDGFTVGQIAKKMAPNDEKRAKQIRSRIRRLMYDGVFENEYGQRSLVEAKLSVGPAVHAIGRKAAAGRVDAAKLVFEASGFYNPRVTHDHGGEIKITIRNAPRPERTEEEYGDNVAITDAEVIEE